MGRIWIEGAGSRQCPAWRRARDGRNETRARAGSARKGPALDTTVRERARLERAEATGRRGLRIEKSEGASRDQADVLESLGVERQRAAGDVAGGVCASIRGQKADGTRLCDGQARTGGQCRAGRRLARRQRTVRGCSGALLASWRNGEMAGLLSRSGWPGARVRTWHCATRRRRQP